MKFQKAERGDILEARKAVKEKCHWNTARPKGGKGCQVLEELQCKKRGKCSFFETTPEFEKRQREFNERLEAVMK